MTNEEEAVKDEHLEKIDDVVIEESTDEEVEEDIHEEVNYKAKVNIQNRILKKEGYVFSEGKWTKPPAAVKPTVATSTKSSSDISPTDLYVLIENKVKQDDIADVQEYASMKGISIAEALKSNVVKTIISDKEEMRNTASAANVGSAKASRGQVTTETLLEKAAKGEMPSNDADLQRLIKARKGIK